MIADDKPRLVNLLSKTISADEGNWLEPNLSHLGGKFTGILIVEAPIQGPDSVDLETLQDALEAIASDLRVDISLS